MLIRSWNDLHSQHLLSDQIGNYVEIKGSFNGKIERQQSKLFWRQEAAVIESWMFSFISMKIQFFPNCYLEGDHSEPAEHSKTDSWVYIKKKHRIFLKPYYCTCRQRNMVAYHGPVMFCLLCIIYVYLCCSVPNIMIYRFFCWAFMVSRPREYIIPALLPSQHVGRLLTVVSQLVWLPKWGAGVNV